MNHIYLTGFMGTGKSTIGDALARHMGRRLLDTDEMIVSRDGRSIPAIFDEEGEPFFRKLERDVISEISAMDEPAVISCGGGVVLSEENVRAMKSSGIVILLTASPGEILRRVESDNNRPLLAEKKTISDIEKMLKSRRDAYEGAADHTIDTEGKSVDEIVKEIVDGSFVPKNSTTSNRKKDKT